MSGQNMVRDLRDGAAVAKPPRERNLLDTVLVIVAVAAVGALAYVGFTIFMGKPAPRHIVKPPAAATALIEDASWTDTDDRTCEVKAATARRSAMVSDPGLANRAVTEGFSGMATLLECKLVTKTERFCEPAGKAALVAMVSDYLGRVDLIVAALQLQGAPMEMMAGMGGELRAGRDIYNLQKDTTLEVMAAYHHRIGDALKALARDGIVAPGDFAAFMGVGIPAEIKQLFDGVTPGASVCA